MVKNFAHRGFSGKYPENTLLAFQKAVELGVDGIELDVQLTKDNKVVVIHDETIDRTSSGSGYVKDYTYEELLEFDFAGDYMGKVEKQKLPLLSEYFQLIKDTDIISNVELKNSVYDYENIEQKVYDLIMKNNLKDKVIISSFNHESMMRMKKIDSSIKCGLLTDSWMINPVKYTKECKMECFHPVGYFLNKEKIKELQKNNIEVNIWLNKYYMDYKELIEMNMDSLITNDPDIIKDILQMHTTK